MPHSLLRARQYHPLHWRYLRLPFFNWQHVDFPSRSLAPSTVEYRLVQSAQAQSVLHKKTLKPIAQIDNYLNADLIRPSTCICFIYTFKHGPILGAIMCPIPCLVLLSWAFPFETSKLPLLFSRIIVYRRFTWSIFLCHGCGYSFVVI